MNIIFHAPFEINPYLKETVLEKIERLDNLNLRFSEADIFFKLKEGIGIANDKEIEIKIHVPGQVFFAKSYGEDYEEAIPKAVGKIRKQLIKYKESMEPKRVAK